jgi:hypothetical protein
MNNENKIALIQCCTEQTEAINTWSEALKSHLNEVFHYLGFHVGKMDTIYNFTTDISDYNIFLLIVHKDSFNKDLLRNLFDTFGENSQNVLLLMKDPVIKQFDISIPGNISTLPLYTYNEENQQYQEISFQQNEKNDHRIWLTLLDVGYEVKRLMKKAEKQEKQIAVYLALTTPDQENFRQNLKRELEHWGCIVYPKRFLPYDKTKLEEELLSYLNKSHLSVHIIGNQYGEIIGDTHKSLIDLQNEIVANFIHHQSLRKGGYAETFRFIWINPDIQSFSPEQEKYIEDFKHNIQFLEQTEVIQTPLESFKTVIKSRMNKLLEEPSEELISDELKVYIIAENYSQPALSDLENELSSRNYKVLKLNVEQPDLNLYTLHKQYLIESQGVIVCCDHGNKNWLNSKLSDILKAPGFGKKKPFLAKGLFMSSESTNGFSARPDITVMKVDESGFSASMIQPFIDKLESKHYEKGQ